MKRSNVIFYLLGGSLLAACSTGGQATPATGNGLFTPGDAASEATARQLATDHIDHDVDMLAGIDMYLPGRVSIDRFGGAHTRLDQSVDGVPVFGRQAIVHLDRTGAFKSYTDGFARDLRVDTTPRLSADQAMDLAVGDAGGWITVTGTPTAELVVLTRDGATNLTWHV